MNKVLSSICMFIILLVSMFTLPSLADATTSVVFDKIEINDVEVTNGGMVFVERGDDLDIRAELFSPVDYKDVRVKASIEGYEYEDIDDSSEIFDIEGSTGIITKLLHLQLPNDIDVGDYSLNVEVSNPLGLKNIFGIVLQIREGRHSLAIQDVVLRPTSSVEAGRPLGIEVRVENMGSRKEEDVMVTASIPDLGVSSRDYINELGFEESDSDDDETSDSVTVYLPIPVDAITGEYELNIDVEYSRGHEIVSAKTKIYVQGTSAAVSSINSIISIDAISKSVTRGNSVTYRLMLANLNQEEAIYSLSVSGTEFWADASFNPGFAKVAPNGAGELTLTVKPKDTATIGDHAFTLRVKENDNTLRDIILTTNISDAKSWTSVKSVLEIGFAVLISLLVILGLIVAFKKLGNKNEPSGPEPLIDDSQSYY